jgi:hypothetical protein
MLAGTLIIIAWVVFLTLVSLGYIGATHDV